MSSFLFFLIHLTSVLKLTTRFSFWCFNYILFLFLLKLYQQKHNYWQGKMLPALYCKLVTISNCPRVILPLLDTHIAAVPCNIHGWNKLIVFASLHQVVIYSSFIDAGKKSVWWLFWRKFNNSVHFWTYNRLIIMDILPIVKQALCTYIRDQKNSTLMSWGGEGGVDTWIKS